MLEKRPDAGGVDPNHARPDLNTPEKPGIHVPVYAVQTDGKQRGGLLAVQWFFRDCGSGDGGLPFILCFQRGKAAFAE